MEAQQENPVVPTWIVIAGAVSSGATLVFLMLLVGIATLGYEVPCNSRFLVVAILAFGAAMSTSFLGGTAAAHGAIPRPFAKAHPLKFSVVGGVAILIITLFGGKALYANADCSIDPRPKPPFFPTDGPQYVEPKLEGRAIDACIKSYLFPEFQQLQCSESAQRIIANEFCKAKGYSIAASWEWKDTGKFHRSYKMFNEIEQDGMVRPRWIVDETSGAVLTLVNCA